MVKLWNDINRRTMLPFFLGFVFLLTFNISFIQNDYIAEYPWAEPSGELLYVTEESPVSYYFQADDDDIYGLTLLYYEAKKPEDVKGNLYTTQLQLLSEQGEELFSYCMINNITKEEENSVGIQLPEGLCLKEGGNYEIQLSSNAPSSENAIGFFKDYWTGGLLVRVFYKWFSRDFVRLICIVSETVLWMGFVLVFSRKKISIEKMFLLASVVLCICWTMMMPCFRVPDEDSHFVRIWGILNHYLLVPENGEIRIPDISVSWQNYTLYYLKNHLAEMNIGAGTRALSCVNMALYNPVVYLLQMIGVGTGRFVAKNIWIICFLGRLVSSVGCSIMIYYAIRWIPYGKTLLALMSLSPVAFQERASLSADAMTYAAVVLLLALCLKIREQKQPVSWRQWGGVTCLILLVASCKVVYFVAAAAVLLIPRSKYVAKRTCYWYRGIVLSFSFILAIGWVKFAGRYLEFTNGGGNAGEKISFVLHNPISYVALLIRTSWEYVGVWMQEMFGSILGYPQRIPVNATLPILLILVFVYEFQHERSRGIKGDRTVVLLSCVVFLTCVLLILSSLYVQWTKGVPSEIIFIHGIQGRYFMPILPFLWGGILKLKNERNAAENSEDIFHAGRMIMCFVLGNLAMLTCVFLGGSFI